MYCLESFCTDPVENLNFEEKLCSLNIEIFMLWRNSPSIIVGRYGNIENDVDVDFANSNNIKIVRRNSGGGTVYHDLGNVNYSFIMKDDKNLTLEYFSRIIIKTLDKIGINANLEFSHNDIKADGLKISGSAQYHNHGIILHHGTLLFDSDLKIMQKILKNCGHVANIRPMLKNDMNINEFMKGIFENVEF